MPDLLKGACKNLTCSQSQHRGNNLKGLWSEPLADLREAPRQGGRNRDPPENTDAGIAILGDLLFHKDSGTGKHHRGVFESSLQSISAGGLPAHHWTGTSPKTPGLCSQPPQDPVPQHQRARGRAWQPTKSRANLIYQHPQQPALSQQKSPSSPQSRHCQSTQLGRPQGSGLWAPQEISYIRPLL